ncbi:MAG: TlpA disulfide reductase family protein [Rudaea sp.]
MFNRTNLLIVVVAIVGAALGLLVGRTFDTPAERPIPAGVVVLKMGDVRPDIAFADLNDQPRRLSEWDGKIVLLNFWATWCGPCREEMPLLDRTRGQNGLEVVGIAVDDASAVKDYLKENPVGYPILIGDDDGNPELLFGDTRSVLPYSVLIGKDGKLLAQRAGSFTPELLHTWLSNNLKQVQ